MPVPALAPLERYFEFKKLKTTWRTEILAGFTTFITMAYIVIVNPSILKDAGMPVSAVFAATCLAAAFATILMGAFARYPIALAPGMGLNAYFTYTVVKGMGVAWQTALGAVFLSGVAFLILTVTGVRQWIIASIPAELYSAVSAGIGLFIAFIGLRNAGIVKADPATIVSMGNLRDPNVALAVFGILVIAALQAWKVRAAILVGILATTALGAFTGLVHWQSQIFHWSDLSGTMLHLDVKAAVGLGLLEIVFVFLFVDLFDNIGTLMAVSKKAGLLEADNRIPRVNRILLTDAVATIGGSLLRDHYRDQLRGKRVWRGCGWQNRRHVHCDGPAFHRCTVRRADCRSGAFGRHVARAGGGGRLDDLGGWRDSMGRRLHSRPRVFDLGDDPAHLQHRQWFGLRHHILRSDSPGARTGAAGTLGRLCAGRVVDFSLRLHRQQDVMRY